MYAVIETGGKQYRVAPGDVLQVEKLAGEAGSEVEFKVIALQRGDGELLTGAQLDTVKVKGEIVGDSKGDKVVVFKFKRKKQYKRTIGHRQHYTTVKVSEIVA